MRTIYVLSAFNPSRHGFNCEVFKSMKSLSKKIDELSEKGFNEFIAEKRRISN